MTKQTTQKRAPRNPKRRKASASPNERVLIVCEGKKTEPNYFNSFWKSLQIPPLLKVPAISVEVVGQGATPITVVKEAVNRKKENRRQAEKNGDIEYEQVWCVFDVEILHKNKSLRPALDKAKANKISVALSNPCFEYWTLLHFERNGSSFDDCEAVISRLGKYIRNYKKSDDVHSQIKDKTETAIENAKAIEKQHPSEDSRVKRNPSTEVYKLVKYLHDMAKKPY